MALKKIDVHCPKCNKKNRIKIRENFTEEDIPNLVDRSALKHTCLICGESWTLDYPIKVESDDYLILYTKEEISDELEEKKVMRVCHTYEDFKEKLLIFNDNLNDIVIEFIKDFLYRKLEDSIKKEVTEMRYDGSNDNELIFYLLGVKKSIGCTKEFYESIKKQSKLKKSKGCIEVHSSNYHKYFKLR